MKMHIVQLTKLQLRHNISKHVIFWITTNWFKPLYDENKLQVDEENNKLGKIEKNENV